MTKIKDLFKTDRKMIKNRKSILNLREKFQKLINNIL